MFIFAMQLLLVFTIVRSYKCCNYFVGLKFTHPAVKILGYSDLVDVLVAYEINSSWHFFLANDN